MRKKVLFCAVLLVTGCSSISKPRLVAQSELPFDQRFQIAVLDFENKTGQASNDPCVKGLSDTVISEILRYGRLRLIEREKLQAVLSELKLEMSGLVNPQNAA